MTDSQSPLSLRASDRDAIDPQLVCAMEDYLRRLESGTELDPNEFLQDYAEIRDELEHCLVGLQFLQCTAPQLKESSSSSVPADPPSMQRGTLGDFRLIREIGRGGMGVVYEAEQISLSRRVAVKVLPFAALLDQRQLERFRNEARAAAMLKHPNIVSVYSVGFERGVHYYAMQYVEGQTVSELIDRLRQSDSKGQEHSKSTSPNARLSTNRSNKTADFIKDAARFALELAAALHYAHEQGVVHRDIKPSNLLLDEKGHAWIADFGLAHVESDQSLTLTGDLLGTLRYMSAEQAEGSRFIDQRTDIYSLGVTLYELTTLRPAFSSSTRQQLLREVLEGRIQRPRQINPAIPLDLETIILKAAAKDPESRYQSADEFAEDLSRFLEHKPIHARRVSTFRKATSWAKRNSFIASLLAIIALLLVSVAVGGLLTARHQGFLSEQRRQLLYDSDVNSAQQALERNNLERVRLLLSRHLPKDGERDLREFAWHYLWSKYQETLETPRFDHGARIHALAYCPDGSNLLTGGSDGSLKLWGLHVGRGQSVRSVSVSDHSIRSMAISSDGQIASIGRTTGPIEICQLETGNTIANLPLDEGTSATALAFSPDGRWLAAAIWRAGKKQNTQKGKHFVYLWNTEDWTVIHKLVGHTKRIEDLAFSVDSELLATTSLDHTIRLWNVNTGSSHKTLAHRHMVYAVTFSPDGKYLASGGYNYEIRLWDTETWEHVLTIREPGHSVSSLAFSPDSQLLASSGRDRVARLWDIPTGKPLRMVRGHADDVQSVRFSPDGKTIASASLDGTVRITECKSQSHDKVTTGHWITRMAYSPDGQRLFSVAKQIYSDNSRRTIWDQRMNQRKLIKPTEVRYGALACSPTSELVAWTGNNTDKNSRPDKTGFIELWTNEALAKSKSATNCGPGDPYAVGFSPSGALLASGQLSGSVCLWRVGTNELTLIQELEPISEFEATVVRFSPNGKLLATASAIRSVVGWRDGRIRIWNIGRRELIKELKGYSDLIMDLEFSPDGKYLASAGYDEQIKLWDVQTWQEVKTIQGHSAWITSLAFSPNGKTLASGSVDASVKLWNAETWNELLTLQRDVGVTDVQFSPDGQSLAVSHVDTSIRLFRVDSSNKPEHFPKRQRLFPAILPEMNR